MGSRARLNGNAVETCQTDANGNIMGLVYASDSVGGAVTVEANAIRLTGGTALANFTETTVGLPIIQNGLTGRSFVNNVMVPVGNTTLAQDLINSNCVRILFLGMEGTSNLTPLGTLGSLTVTGSGDITFNYGATGIGGDQNSIQGDGIYRFEVDYTQSGFANLATNPSVKFHRVFGDVDGNGVVDAADYSSVINRSVFGKYGVFSQDTNGAGRVFSKDITNTLRQRGHRVALYNSYG